jgi:hypothetical protein
MKIWQQRYILPSRLESATSHAGVARRHQVPRRPRRRDVDRKELYPSMTAHKCNVRFTSLEHSSHVQRSRCKVHSLHYLIILLCWPCKRTEVFMHPVFKQCEARKANTLLPSSLCETTGVFMHPVVEQDAGRKADRRGFSLHRVERRQFLYTR